MARLSGYNFYCNDVNGKFGTPQTATGVPISETHYTAAIPMQAGRTPYKLGDVVLIKNTQNNTSALYHVTDVGGLPHADIDVVAGVGLKALGVDATIGKGGGVNAVSQKEGFETQKVGRLPLKYGDNQSAHDLQLVLSEINQGKADLSELEKVSGFQSDMSGDDLKQTLVSYAPNVKPDILNSGKAQQYADYNPSAPRRPKDEYLAYIQDLMKEDPAMGFLLLIVAVMTGMLDEEQTSSLLDSFGNLSPDNQRKALDSAPEGYGGSFRGATGSAEGYTAPAPDESKFNYDLLDAQKFQKATIYPVKNQDDRLITSEFGPRDLGYGSKNHPACDLRAAPGMEVVSMFDGKVVKVGQMTVTVQNDNGTTTTYMHVDAKAKIGDEVKAGDTVAKVLPKCSRSPYDPHLDVRTIDSKSGIYINPEKYMDYDKMGVKHKGDLGPTSSLLYNPETKQFVSKDSVNTKMAQMQADPEARKLTSANISLQDQKVEGWPPGINPDVLAQAKAASVNSIA